MRDWLDFNAPNTKSNVARSHRQNGPGALWRSHAKIEREIRSPCACHAGCRIRRPPLPKPLICRVSSAVEQRFCKPLVGGSSPSPGTNEIKYLRTIWPPKSCQKSGLEGRRQKQARARRAFLPPVSSATPAGGKLPRPVCLEPPRGWGAGSEDPGHGGARLGQSHRSHIARCAWPAGAAGWCDRVVTAGQVRLGFESLTIFA
jgi:hypothetical protein